VPAALRAGLRRSSEDCNKHARDDHRYNNTTLQSIIIVIIRIIVIYVELSLCVCCAWRNMMCRYLN